MGVTTQKNAPTLLLFISLLNTSPFTGDFRATLGRLSAMVHLFIKFIVKQSLNCRRIPVKVSQDVQRILKNIGYLNLEIKIAVQFRRWNAQNKSKVMYT